MNGSAPASGAVFRAIAENSDAWQRSNRGKIQAQRLNAWALSATPEAVVIPANL
jgi:hypothetical protein